MENESGDPIKNWESKDWESEDAKSCTRYIAQLHLNSSVFLVLVFDANPKFKQLLLECMIVLKLWQTKLCMTNNCASGIE